MDSGDYPKHLLENATTALEYILSDPTGANLNLSIPELLYDVHDCMLRVKHYIGVLEAVVAECKKRKKTEDVVVADSSDLHVETPRVKGLSRIAGLSETKELLTMSVSVPLVQPQLFVDRPNFNSVLLYGPPGTGKTNIVHALAFECQAKLQCISPSCILSSLVGETEKKLRAVFEAFAGTDEVSILFIDDVDGICRKRSDGEQEYARRLKTELMCQMSKMSETRNRFLICATNCPWDLDLAFMRHFQKRVYVPLPGPSERVELLRLFAGEHCPQFIQAEWKELISGTKGFSGSDIQNLVQTALNAPIEELVDTQLWKLCPDGTYQPLVATDDVSNITWINTKLLELPKGTVRARPVRPQDFIDGLSEVKATVPQSSVLKFDTFHSQ